MVAAGDMGYEVFAGDKTLKEVKQGEEKEFFTWVYLRQNTLELYGCSNPEELEFFKFLMKISGIGPKIALSLAEFGSPDKLKEEMEKKGSSFSQEIKGLGRKKMKQLLLELTGKVKELNKGRVSEREEAVKALTNLGFSKKQAEKAVLKVPEEVDDSEKVIERALKLLGQDDD